MIHYHGVPFGGTVENQLALQGRHAMVSFASKQHTEMVAEVTQSFCLDNGAFTAWKSGNTYDFGGYWEYADHWLRHPGCDFAIIPDVIDGTEAENDKLVDEALGKDVTQRWVPVWHLHESVDRLRSLAGFPLVGLGSSGDYATVGNAKWWQRMGEALDAITDEQGRPITKLHGLRMLDPGVFSYIPFASADSTNVARNIGMDTRWRGPYVPASQRVKALVLMDRIEAHASASHWVRNRVVANQQNFDLVG